MAVVCNSISPGPHIWSTKENVTEVTRTWSPIYTINLVHLWRLWCAKTADRHPRQSGHRDLAYNTDIREEMSCFLKCISPHGDWADMASHWLLLTLSATALKVSGSRIMSRPLSTEYTVNLAEPTSANNGCTVCMGHKAACNHSSATRYRSSTHFSSATERTAPNHVLYSRYLAT